MGSEAMKLDSETVPYEMAELTAPIVYVRVTDRKANEVWLIAPASCGLKCRCAAEGIRLVDADFDTTGLTRVAKVSS